MDKTIIISLCDYSGVWSQPYRDAGYEVIQVDKKLGHDARLWPSPESDTPRLPSEFLDITDYVDKVRGVLAAPVCTAFSGAGARHPRSDDEIREGLALADACMRISIVTQADWWAMENPVGKLRKWIGEPLLRFQPCDYAGWADERHTHYVASTHR
jgi:hypothetical protein